MLISAYLASCNTNLELTQLLRLDSHLALSSQEDLKVLEVSCFVAEIQPSFPLNSIIYPEFLCM